MTRRLVRSVVLALAAVSLTIGAGIGIGLGAAAQGGAAADRHAGAHGTLVTGVGSRVDTQAIVGTSNPRVERLLVRHRDPETRAQLVIGVLLGASLVAAAIAMRRFAAPRRIRQAFHERNPFAGRAPPLLVASS